MTRTLCVYVYAGPLTGFLPRKGTARRVRSIRGRQLLSLFVIMRAPWRLCVYVYTRKHHDCHVRAFCHQLNFPTHTHPGRSRNDQVATDVRLYLREEAQRIQVSDNGIMGWAHALVYFQIELCEGVWCVAPATNASRVSLHHPPTPLPHHLPTHHTGPAVGVAADHGVPGGGARGPAHGRLHAPPGTQSPST